MDRVTRERIRAVSADDGQGNESGVRMVSGFDQVNSTTERVAFLAARDLGVILSVQYIPMIS